MFGDLLIEFVFELFDLGLELGDECFKLMDVVVFVADFGKMVLFLILDFLDEFF